jgi:hypothetical protein
VNLKNNNDFDISKFLSSFFNDSSLEFKIPALQWPKHGETSGMAGKK